MKKVKDTGHKKCPKCGEVKPYEDFSINQYTKKGLQAYCKQCNIEYYNENYDSIRVKQNEYYKEYYLENKAELNHKRKLYQRERRKKLKEKLLALKSKL